MTDRLVRQVSPTPKDDARRELKRFSEYSLSPNIILLGDPGAGKSHLFEVASVAESAELLTARAFLNAPSIEQGKTLFIDGLDEKRSGRGDQNTIDELVKKLFASKPTRVRISCRAQEWLGETDLVALRQYFDTCGGVIVLELDQLTTDEQLAVLVARGLSNPDGLLSEAVNRGLSEYLVNPQNLVMLV